MGKGQSAYAKARSIDLVDYLASLGHLPLKIKGPDFWYLSPLRSEKHPSFKVNRNRNIWYDHGTGNGGNLIEFGKIFFGCSMEEFLARISDTPSNIFSFHNPLHFKRLSAESETYAIQ